MPASTPTPAPMLGLRRLLVVVGGLAVAASFLFQLHRLLSDTSVLPPDDFVEYYAAGRLNVQGENAYAPEKLLPLERQAGRDTDEAVMMWNPPWTLPLVMPFGLLDARTGQMIWLALNLLLIIFCADWLWRYYGGSTERRWLAWIVALTFLPTIFVLQSGQITPLILLGLVGFLHFQRLGKGWLAGASLVLVAIKPHLVCLVGVAMLLWCLDRRSWSVLLGGMLGGLSAVLIALAFNPLVLVQYRDALAHHPPEQWISPTIGALFRLVFGPERFWLQFLPPLVGVLWLVPHWLKHRRTWEWGQQLPLLLLVSFLTAPYGAWPFDLVVLLLPVIQMAVWASAKRKPATLAIVAYVSIDGLALALNLLHVESVWFVWMTPALLLSYIALRQFKEARLGFALSRLLKPFLRPETAIFVAMWLLLMIGGHSRFFRDPGTFWHTVVGERILSTGEFLDHDPFSYTFGGSPWTPYEWLAECGMALIHRIDGFDSLLVAAVTIVAGLFTWVARRLMRAGLHWSLTACCLMLLLAASASHLHVRPHLLTIAFLGITFAWLTDFEAGRIGFRRRCWLIPLFILWTNCHGGMLGGLGTLGLALIGWSLWRLAGLHSPLRDKRTFVALASLCVGCALTAFINPYGADLPLTWYTIMRAPLLPEIIQEHAPLNPTKADGLMVLTFGAVYMLALLRVRLREIRVTWLLPLVWLVLACIRIRHAPLFAITAGLALADLLPYTRWARWLARLGRDLFQFRVENTPARWDWRPALLPVVLVTLTLSAQALRMTLPVVGHGWARLDPALWPVELLPDLRKEADAHPDAPIFNEYAFGGFLIYYTPGLRVYVDDRCEVYGDQWLYEYVRAGEGNPGPYLEERQRRYGRFDLALTQVGSGYDIYFSQSPDWQVVKQTRAATLYRRANARASRARYNLSPPAQE